MSGIEAHPLAVDGGPGIGEHPQGDVVVDLDADLGEQLVGLGLDQGEPFLADELVGRDLPADERRPLGTEAGAGPRVARAAGATGC